MAIQKIFVEYSSRVAKIHLYQRAAKNNAEAELRKLLEFEKKTNLNKSPISMSQMIFRDVDGKRHSFGYFKSNIEESKKSVFIHKNKQFQWLLTETYECFEEFLDHAYGYAGYCKKDFWPLGDYGNITLSELKDKELPWFIEQAKKKKNRPHSIINQFRTKFNRIIRIEMDNHFNINLRLAVVLIEQLRHVIVHNGGIISDNEIFIEKTLKKAGLFNNGNYDKDDVDFVQSFLGEVDGKIHVVLLEVNLDPKSPLNLHVDVFQELSNYLMAYAHQICLCLKEEQD